MPFTRRIAVLKDAAKNPKWGFMIIATANTVNPGDLQLACNLFRPFDV